MKWIFLGTLGFCLAVSVVWGQGFEKISVPPPVNLERAELYVLSRNYQARAVLVLCPGVNGDGGEWRKDAAWIEFAHEQKVALTVMSFASPMNLLPLGRGYYYAGQGSGDALLLCLKSAGLEGLPILIFGFSGGAHFTASFVEWQPERVSAWCAYSAAWWDEPCPDNQSPPGIVACGVNDQRFEATLRYFQQGRALGNPWAWVGLPNTGHQFSPVLEQFARDCFAAVLSGKTGTWIDSSGALVARLNGWERDSQVMWLPDGALSEKWKRINGL